MNHEFHDHKHGERSERDRGPRGNGRSRGRSPGGHRAGPFGRGDEMFRGGFPRGRQRLRRGDVRAAVLVLLDESPRNGYQIIQELSERSNGAWRPSPGSVYPILQQLEDEGLVEISSTVSGKTYVLTATGKALVEKDRATLGKPWETAAADVSDATSELFGTLRQVVHSVRQVAMAGSDAQTRKAATILADARRSIYRLLAEDES
ncbi:MAG TPA: PadR family transcriptional regulator [Acidimicrobiales bacterium]|nr:PadR family transcriptional regulator [Acidimicrobiales bacterium]